MSGAEHEETHTYNTSSNQGYQTASALQIRLDTSMIIQDLEKFLSGKMIVYETDSLNRVRSREIDVGQPMANKKGIQCILAYVRSMINPQNVQGNFELIQEYYEYLERSRLDFSKFLMTNLHEFGIKIGYYSGIIGMVFRMVEPFMTRLIKNKERDSYANTIQHKESSSSEIRGKGMSVPFFGGRG